MSYESDTLADADLRFYYRLGEPSGTTMTDLGPNAHDGTYTGSPTLDVAGAIAEDDGAIDFDGSTQYGSATHDAASHAFGTGSYTLEAWVNPDATSASMFVVCHAGNAAADEWEMFVASSGYVQARIGTTNVTTTSPAVSASGGWYHLVASYDRSANQLGYIYVNGVLASSATDISAMSAQPIGDTSRTFYIARRTSTGYFDGQIDEVAGYDVFKDESWAAARYALGLSGAGQIIKPDADTTTTGWTDTPLWSKVDDDPASPDGTVISATAA